MLWTPAYTTYMPLRRTDLLANACGSSLISVKRNTSWPEGICMEKRSCVTMTACGTKHGGQRRQRT